MKTAFKRRSILYVPGTSEKMMRKALDNEQLDGIIFDLEDAVSPAEKDNARELVCRILKEIRAGEEKREILVRINPVDTKYAMDDIAAVAQFCPDTIIVTKATQEAVITFSNMLLMAEKKYGLAENSIGIIPLIESAQGVEEIYDIIRASARITGAQFGGEDFTKDMEIARTDLSEELRYSRNRMAVACKAARVDCIDTPYVNFKDVEGCEKDTCYVKSIGMTGRTMIHPALTELTNRIFSVTEEELAYARQVVAVYEEAIEQAKGAVALNGKMIDLPVYERAKKTLERA